jgi:hypothetical protein
MILRPILLLLCFFGVALGQNPPERTRLYKKPDPGSTGGLRGSVGSPSLPIEQILAVSAEDVDQVYEGQVGGAQRNTFQFNGLPVGKYDLVVVFATEFYEGLHLNAVSSTLSPGDLAKIDASIQKSEPYFPKKFIHRVEGTSGRGQEARAVCTYFRDKGSELDLEKFEGKSSRPDFRRTFKLVLLKDVGPGWQIARARDLYPVWMNPKSALPVHKHSDALHQLRVADQMKDLGALQLSR